jgi:hypothetical protein
MDELSKPNPEKKVAPPMNIESKVSIPALPNLDLRRSLPNVVPSVAQLRLVDLPQRQAAIYARGVNLEAIHRKPRPRRCTEQFPGLGVLAVIRLFGLFVKQTIVTFLGHYLLHQRLPGLPQVSCSSSISLRISENTP